MRVRVRASLVRRLSWILGTRAASSTLGGTRVGLGGLGGTWWKYAGLGEIK